MSITTFLPGFCPAKLVSFVFSLSQARLLIKTMAKHELYRRDGLMLLSHELKGRINCLQKPEEKVAFKAFLSPKYKSWVTRVEIPVRTCGRGLKEADRLLGPV